MRSILFGLVVTVAVACMSAGQITPDNNAVVEAEIRAREQAQVDALLRHDIAAMRKNWAADYVVNNPRNEVMEASKGRIQSGERTYSSFSRIIEKVLLHGDTVIVMGLEVVVPSGNASDAGRTINRRFTNIWMKRNGKWLLTARQATVICKDDNS